MPSLERRWMCWDRQTSWSTESEMLALAGPLCELYLLLHVWMEEREAWPMLRTRARICGSSVELVNTRVRVCGSKLDVLFSGRAVNTQRLLLRNQM